MYGTDPMSMSRWVVVRTKSRRERWAAENVQRQGCDFYLPQYEVPPSSNGRIKVARAEVLFPCYLFVRINQQWKFLLSTFGVTAVILQHDGPAVIPQQEIDNLMRRHDLNGLIHLPDKFQLNQEVRVRGGPFKGHTGLWQGQTSSERQKVLIDFLGGKITGLFDKKLLEVA
jgi:transcriptional antiterminator RfaH